MIIVIDAYNVLKQVIHEREVTVHERIQFLNQLSSYGKRKNNKVVVVFDGGSSERPTKEKMGRVCVVYSGYQETADDYIRRYLKDHKAQDILLVSSDRELNRAADSFHIPSLEAIDFYRIIKDEQGETSSNGLGRLGPAIKTSGQEQPELDRIMQEASRHVEYKVEDVVGKHAKKSTQKLSKKERKLMEKLKKL